MPMVATSLSEDRQPATLPRSLAPLAEIRPARLRDGLIDLGEIAALAGLVAR